MKKYLPRVILYEHRQKDRDILDWIDKLPSGFKTQAIKDAIWASITQTPPPESPRVFMPNQPKKAEARTINSASTMRAEVTFDTHELLADIRQIVEIGVASALGHHTAPTTSKEDENEIEEILDDLELSFMLDDDDEEEE